MSDGEDGAEVESEREGAVLYLEYLVRDLERLEGTMHQQEIPPPFKAGSKVEIRFTSGWAWESATGVRSSASPLTMGRSVGPGSRTRSCACWLRLRAEVRTAYSSSRAHSLGTNCTEVAASGPSQRLISGC
eukprot:2785817-Rhodomonas_salina.1